MDKSKTEGLTISQRIERGRCIARLYIAAQHLSQLASDEACYLIEDANDPWQNHGFNREMMKSPYGIRAGHGEDMKLFRNQSEWRESLNKSLTEPWKLPVIATTKCVDGKRSNFFIPGELV